mgnify:CR=1 FL=1
MLDRGQRTTITVRLIGRDTASRWRRLLITEGLAVPSGGGCAVALADLSGHDRPDDAIADMRRLAGTEPLIVLQRLGDVLPNDVPADVVLLRCDPERPAALIRALRAAALHRLYASAAGVRLRALASLGQTFPYAQSDGAAGPTAMLTEPHPGVLAMLSSAGWQELVTPLTSSQTLRLLENNHASALIVHLSDVEEHRLPILKLIRRQTELRELPVAVVAREWTGERVGQWLDAGADLVAYPDEVPGILGLLRGAAMRFRTRQSLSAALTASAITDDGHASPILGPRVFERVVDEHRELGDRIAYGAIELKPADRGSEPDIAEAGIYMAMALSPLELIVRPRADLFFVAMPYADRFFGGRVMRSMETLIEDLKFGDEPDPVLMTARHRCIDGEGLPPAEARLRLERMLARDTRPAAFA